MKLLEILAGVHQFQTKAHEILGKHEASPSRVIALFRTYKQLSGLTIQQDDLFRQALRCIEQELYRAAHVMAWAAFIDFLQEKIVSKGFNQIHRQYPNWSRFSTIEDLRENIPEYQFIECARKLGLCNKMQMKALHGLLSKRNECAHPSDYYPELNESLGYISELFKRIAQIQPK